MRHIKMCFPEYLVGGVYLHCPVMSYCQNCCVIRQNELNEAQPCFFLVIGIDLQSLVIERNDHTYQCKPREMFFEKFRRYIYINQRYLRLLNVRFFALPPSIFGLIDEWFILRALFPPPPFDQVQSLSTITKFQVCSRYIYEHCCYKLPMSCYVALVLTRERVLEILSLLLTQQHVSTMRFVILI